MAYRVHKFDIDMEEDKHQLEEFLNELEGEVVAIIPNVRSTSLSQIAGAVSKVDFLFIVEQV